VSLLVLFDGKRQKRAKAAWTRPGRFVEEAAASHFPLVWHLFRVTTELKTDVAPAAMPSVTWPTTTES
jgi:hypothetical protein